MQQRRQQRVLVASSAVHTLDISKRGDHFRSIYSTRSKSISQSERFARRLLSLCYLDLRRICLARLVLLIGPPRDTIPAQLPALPPRMERVQR